MPGEGDSPPRTGGPPAPGGKGKGKAKTKVVASSAPCRYFGSAKGCNFGDNCAYSHKNPNTVKICRDWEKDGKCKFEDKCFYRHKADS